MIVLSVGFSLLFIAAFFSIVFTSYGIPVVIGSIFIIGSFILTDFICFDSQCKSLRGRVDRMVAKLFIKLIKARQVTPPEVSFGGLGEKKLYRWEIEKLVELIVRDFVQRWYSTLSEDDHFPSEVKHLLLDFSMVVEDRLSRTDTKEVFCDLLSVAVRHLSVLNDIGCRRKEGVFLLDSSSVSEFVNEPSSPVHPALQSRETELRYIRACLDCVCELGIPEEFKHSTPARLFLRELLATNLFAPLVELLSDPNFLMKAIVAIFSKSPPEKFKLIRESMQQENERLLERLSVKRHKDHPDSSSPVATSTPETSRRLSLRVGQSDGKYSTSDVVSVDPRMFIMMDFQECENVDSKFIGYTIQFSMAVLSEHVLDELGWSDAAGLSVPVKALTRFSDYEKLMKDWTNESYADNNISIMKHVTALPYLEKTTMFTVMSKFPFPRTSQMDTQLMEGRKKSLERFLKATWSHPELISTTAFQNFLKTSIMRYQWHLGDGTQFVARRGRVNRGSSSDDHPYYEQPQVYIQAVLTSYLNAQLPMSYRFPLTPAQTPLAPVVLQRTQSREGDEESQNNVDSELTASAVLESTHLELLDAHRRTTSTAGRDEFHDFPDEEIPDHVTSHVTSNSCKKDQIKLYLSFIHKAVLSSMIQREVTTEVEGEGVLANGLFSFATEAARPVCSHLWLCKERIQRAILGLFGGAMDEGLMELVSEVTTDEEKWARILYHLRHTLWPNGVLDVAKGKQVSYPEQRLLREGAANEFKRFLPNVFPYLVGDGNLTSVIKHGLDCLEHPELNKHLLYNLVDVLMLHLMPELKSEPLVAVINKERL